jgi:hypothetical protein
MTPVTRARAGKFSQVSNLLFSSVSNHVRETD